MILSVNEQNSFAGPQPSLYCVTYPRLVFSFANQSTPKKLEIARRGTSLKVFWWWLLVTARDVTYCDNYVYLERFTDVYLTGLFMNNPHKYLFPQDLVMLYLLWCLKVTVVSTLHFTGLATKFMLLMVLFHNRHTVEKLTANHIAKRWKAAWGLTVLFCVSHRAGRLTLFMMSKFPLSV